MSVCVNTVLYATDILNAASLPHVIFLAKGLNSKADRPSLFLKHN